jgi:hypothetical protein
MAGHVVERFWERELEAQGGWESIRERVRNGEGQRKIAESYGISQGWLSRWIDKNPERKQQYRDDLRASAHVLADEVKEIADALPGEDQAGVAAGRERINARRWLASVRNREEYGEPQAGVQVNVLGHAAVHLGALRHRTVELSMAAPEIAADASLGARGISDATVTTVQPASVSPVT